MLTAITLAVWLSAGQPARPGKSLDVCAMLTSAEIRAVLGDEVKERTPNTQPAGGLLMSQCFYGTSSARSVSLAVATTAVSARSRITPRAYWRRQFHPGDRDEKKEEHETGAREIRGVGDEAFWSGTRIAGALYVLRGDKFLRISVGGIRDEAERIEKSKALALAAIERL